MYRIINKFEISVDLPFDYGEADSEIAPLEKYYPFFKMLYRNLEESPLGPELAKDAAPSNRIVSPWARSGTITYSGFLDIALAGTQGYTLALALLQNSDFLDRLLRKSAADTHGAGVKVERVSVEHIETNTEFHPSHRSLLKRVSFNSWRLLNRMLVPNIALIFLSVLLAYAFWNQSKNNNQANDRLEKIFVRIANDSGTQLGSQGQPTVFQCTPEVHVELKQKSAAAENDPEVSVYRGGRQ